MKSRIAIALATLSFAFGLFACVAEPDDGASNEEVVGAVGAVAEAAEPISGSVSGSVSGQLSAPISAGALGDPTTQTEYIYFRCSLNGGLYTTRPLCLESCGGGTCRIILICKNDQGQQIPCP